MSTSDSIVLATKLVEHWQEFNKGTWQNKGIEAGQLAQALEFLSKTSFLPEIATIAKDASGIGVAIDAIKLFQTVSGMVLPDGVLGKRTLSMLNLNRGCSKKPEDAKPLPPGISKRAGINTAAVFYHVDEKVTRLIPYAIHYIAKAWKSWQIHIQLYVERVDSPNEANVLIKLASIDGSGGVLGDATIGGFGKMHQLTCRFDENETWTEGKFLGTAVHEFGHLLGLTHSHTPNQLMNPVMRIDDSAIRIPQREDAQRIREIWPKEDSMVVVTTNSPRETDVILGF